MKKLCIALAATLAISTAAPAIAADLIPAPPPPPPPTCHETYGIFAIFHCWHHGGHHGWFHHHGPAPHAAPLG